MKRYLNEYNKDIIDNMVFNNKRFFIDKSDINKLIRLYYKNTSVTKLAKIFKCSVTTICTELRKNNCKIRGRFEYITKYYCDENYFDNIDIEDKSFFLGLLFSDGWVSSNKNMIELHLQERDLKILEDFTNCIKSNRPIRHVHRKTKLGNISHLSIMEINSNHIKNTLIKHGVVPRKTFVKIFPEVIFNADEDIIRHFVRGYFCGNGSLKGTNSRVHENVLNCSTFKITSTKMMCCAFQYLIYKYTGVNCKIEKYKNSYNVYNYTLLGSYLISHWLFKNSTYYIERKYNFYKILENTIKFKKLI